MKSIVNAHPFFPTSLVEAPSPSPPAVSLDVPGVTPSPCHAFLSWHVLFVFAIFVLQNFKHFVIHICLFSHETMNE